MRAPPSHKGYSAIRPRVAYGVRLMRCVRWPASYPQWESPRLFTASFLCPSSVTSDATEMHRSSVRHADVRDYLGWYLARVRRTSLHPLFSARPIVSTSSLRLVLHPATHRALVKMSSPIGYACAFGGRRWCSDLRERVGDGSAVSYLAHAQSCFHGALFLLHVVVVMTSRLHALQCSVALVVSCSSNSDFSSSGWGVFNIRSI